MPWVVRKILGCASLSLNISQAVSRENPNPESKGTPGCNELSETPVTTLHIKQTVSPGSFDSEGYYPINGEDKEYSLPVFGDITMRLRYVNTSEVSDKVLRQRLSEGSPSKTVIDEIAHNRTKGWDARVIWGFEIIDGYRYLTRNVITTKDEKAIESRLVYDFHC